jgi:sugar (pentulose or hexulose) kinase
LDRADKLLFLPDLLTYYLTGERVTERTIASVTQMYDHATDDWSDAVLDRYGIARRLFAPFASAGTVAGRIRGDVLDTLGIRAPAQREIKAVVTAEHDTASAFMAAGADTLIISSGTWSLVGCEHASPIISPYGFKYNIANEGGIPGHYRLIRNVMGNWLLQEVRRAYAAEGVDMDFSALGAEAARLDPYRFVVDVDLPAFYEPGHMREKIARVCMDAYGTAPASPAEFAACIGTSLAFKYRWAMEKLARLRGRAFTSVNIIGGGSRDGHTAQLTADVTGLPVSCGPEDASALGCVLFQLIAAGEIGSIDEGREIVRRSTRFSRYEPADRGGAREAYEAFVARL